MPSSFKILEAVCDFLKNEPSLTTIVDLGAGFGFSTIYLAKRFPNRKIVAIEGQRVPFYVLWILKKWTRRSNIELLKKNFFDLPLIQADFVFCYLYHDQKGRIAHFLQNVLQPKTIVVSSTFALDLKKIDQKKVPDLFQTPLYFYEICNFEKSANLISK
jgi:SAM-dependent methyltransferase